MGELLLYGTRVGKVWKINYFLVFSRWDPVAVRDIWLSMFSGVFPLFLSRPRTYVSGVGVRVILLAVRVRF